MKRTHRTESADTLVRIRRVRSTGALIVGLLLGGVQCTSARAPLDDSAAAPRPTRPTPPTPPTPPGDAASPLEGTRWTLVALGDTPVSAASPQQEPHLILDPATRRVSGSGGCNRLAGSYELRGDRLTFGGIVGTMMACTEGMDTEKAFLDALGEVRRWRIVGSQLALLDAVGGVLARLQARRP